MNEKNLYIQNFRGNPPLPKKFFFIFFTYNQFPERHLPATGQRIKRCCGLGKPGFVCSDPRTETGPGHAWHKREKLENPACLPFRCIPFPHPSHSPYRHVHCTSSGGNLDSYWIVASPLLALSLPKLTLSLTFISPGRQWNEKGFYVWSHVTLQNTTF